MISHPSVTTLLLFLFVLSSELFCSILCFIYVPSAVLCLAVIHILFLVIDLCVFGIFAFVFC